MQYESRNTYLRWRHLLLVLVVGFALATAFRISSAALTGHDPAPQQEVIRLESRLNQVELRLYAIETSVRSLELQTRAGNVPSRGVTQEDLVLLRSELQTLQRRLIDDECGLAKLDERTLNREVRDARRKSGGNNNPCRLAVAAPVRLPDAREWLKGGGSG